jgi:hypothetical protein
MTPISIRNGVIMIPAASPDIAPNNVRLRRECFVVIRPFFDFKSISYTLFAASDFYNIILLFLSK